MFELDKIIVVDTETGGLDADRHPIWEVCWATWEETRWSFRQRSVLHDPGQIDPWVLDNTGYRDSYRQSWAEPPSRVWAEFAREAEGRHIVGMVPSFDEERIRRALWAHCEQRPTWHYHLIDVETLMVGHLHADGMLPVLPWSSDELSRTIGVEPDEFERHSAMGDVEWSIACLASLGLVPPDR